MKIHISLLTALIGSCILPANGYGQTNTAPATTSTQSDKAYFQPLELSPTAYDVPYRIALFNPKDGEDGARVWSQTKSIFAYGFVAFGVLAALPEESTGWEKNTDFFGKWIDNVKDSPEWDRNDFVYNYAGHMYFGGVYYVVARKSGYRQWDSFIYSFLMSTFYWEYGVEAFAEIPSIQDIVFTPIAGWLYGEWAYQTEMNIRAANNKVLGSGFLGGLSLILLDPVDSAGRGVNYIFGRQLIKSGYGYFSYVPSQTPEGETDHTVYLHMRIPIGAAGPDEPNKITTINHVDDPVDKGIIGVSGSVGYTGLDSHWNVENGLYSKITLGLYFTPRVSLRLGYAWGNLEKTTGESIDYENYSINSQVYMNTKGRLRPYLTGGLGRQTWERDNDTANFQWNGGLGLYCKVIPKLALTADWLNYYSPSSKTYDQQYNLGLIYRFGHGEHNDW
ncbi:DUF3943 domain-containing protein [Pontiellaceae bacterium B12219]|nr:DUF3943 domain-containing protein [Pontiellaceae bacterium B12219]